MTREATRRQYGPDVGEPPPAVDPRRWGSLIGVVGGLVFVFDNGRALGPVVAVVSGVTAVLLTLVIMYGHYVRPRALGVLRRPHPAALIVYVLCVAGEVALLAAGSGLLVQYEAEDLRPALIAAVVGLHFLPFSWAFSERRFLLLGGLLTALGTAGLIVGAAGVARAAQGAATAAGLAMLTVIAAYARGRFALAT